MFSHSCGVSRQEHIKAHNKPQLTLSLEAQKAFVEYEAFYRDTVVPRNRFHRFPNIKPGYGVDHSELPVGIDDEGRFFESWQHDT